MKDDGFYPLLIHFIILMIEREHLDLILPLVAAWFLHICYGEWHHFPLYVTIDKHSSELSIKPGDTEKSSAILCTTSSTKTNKYLYSDTLFHKVPMGVLLDHCLSEPSPLVSLIFPISVVVMFASDAISSQDFSLLLWRYDYITR